MTPTLTPHSILWTRPFTFCKTSQFNKWYQHELRLSLSLLPIQERGQKPKKLPGYDKELRQSPKDKDSPSYYLPKGPTRRELSSKLLNTPPKLLFSISLNAKLMRASLNQSILVPEDLRRPRSPRADSQKQVHLYRGWSSEWHSNRMTSHCELLSFKLKCRKKKKSFWETF